MNGKTDVHAQREKKMDWFALFDIMESHITAHLCLRVKTYTAALFLTMCDVRCRVSSYNLNMCVCVGGEGGETEEIHSHTNYNGREKPAQEAARGIHLNLIFATKRTRRYATR